MSDIVKGFGTVESPLVQDLLAADSKPVPGTLCADGNYMPNSTEIPFSTYYSKEYAALEDQFVWKKCWQFACREEDIPNIGDKYVYDVGSASYVIVRSESGVKAFYNTCLHRGTRLCDSHSSSVSLRCPFHGWQWENDGSVKHIPGQWDFPDAGEDYRLPEAKIGVWGGCIFINPDPDCGPLDDALGDLKAHFAHFDLGKRFTLVKTAKKIRANWKTVWEAFLEAYHVAETHFDAVDFNGDVNTKYDIFDNGIVKHGRLITPSAVPSPSLNDSISAREAAIIATKSFAAAFGPAAEETLPDFDKFPDYGRKDVAAWRRSLMRQLFGADMSALPDAEMLDSIQYDMFPNFGAWLGEGLPLMYQFIPYGDDPNESLFVVRLLAPLADESARPPAPEMTHLDFDDMFETLPQWGRIAHIFDQDMSNLPLIQKGMRAASPERPNVILGRYQEQRIALLHEFLEEQIRHGRE